MATGGGSTFYNYETTNDLSEGLAAKREGTEGYKDWFFKHPNYIR